MKEQWVRLQQCFVRDTQRSRWRMSLYRQKRGCQDRHVARVLHTAAAGSDPGRPILFIIGWVWLLCPGRRRGGEVVLGHETCSYESG